MLDWLVQLIICFSFFVAMMRKVLYIFVSKSLIGLSVSAMKLAVLDDAGRSML